MEKHDPHLSIVIPVYQAADLIEELIERIIAQLTSLSSAFEIILIDDGSQDQSWEKIAEQCQKDPRIQGIKLSRNFGQHAAIAAGIDTACGEWVIVMDCDLQDRPEEIPSLYWKAQEGYEIVLAQRKLKESNFRSQFASRLFYRILSLCSGTKWDSSIGNFGIYHRAAVQSMILVKNNIPFFPAIVQWVGFTRTSIPVEHAKRPRGKSSYSFLKKLNLASSVLLFYNERLFKFITTLGFLLTFSSLLAAWKFSAITLFSFFCGLIIFSLGILGLLLGKISRSMKTTPSYLIQKKIHETNIYHTL